MNRKSQGGRVMAFGASALIVLMTAGIAIAQQDFNSRPRMSSSGGGVSVAGAQSATGWSSNGTVTTTVQNVDGTSALFVMRGGSGQITMNDSTGTTLRYTTSTVLLQDGVTNTFTGPVIATHANTKGTVTLVAGAGSRTVTTGAICTCVDTTANASVRCSVAATTLSIVGTATDVIAYICL